MTAALPAFLIMHTIAFGNQAQTLEAYWFPNPIACEQAKPRYAAMRKQVATVTVIECSDRQPAWWR